MLGINHFLISTFLKEFGHTWQCIGLKGKKLSAVEIIRDTTVSVARQQGQYNQP
jgi:hypothetical protein